MDHDYCSMAAQNVIGDAFRGATWVSLHNGGGTGWEKQSMVDWHGAGW